MKTNFQKAKLKLLSTQPTDPPRYPKLTNPIENETKGQFHHQMDMMIVDITKNLIDKFK